MGLNLILVFATTLFLIQSHAVPMGSCSAFYQFDLSKHLTFTSESSEFSVVKYMGHRKQKIVFRKEADAAWLSLHHAYENTLTAEADVRLPIFLFGVRLAKKLGFSIRELADGSIEIEIPDADGIARMVSEINLVLKKRGQEPITYLPRRAGLVAPEEGLRMSLDVSGDILLNFPYADLDPRLASHEVTFHLGSLLLPREMTRRAFEVNQETLSFVEFLRDNESKLGPKTKEIIEQILIERNFELDNSTATLTASPGFTRKAEKMVSYKEIIPRFDDNAWRFMTNAVEYIARPGLQPAEAILHRLHLMVGLDIRGLVKNELAPFKTANAPAYNLGNKIKLNQKELQNLKELVLLFQNKERPIRELTEPHILLELFLSNLDQRIEEIADAVPN